MLLHLLVAAASLSDDFHWGGTRGFEDTWRSTRRGLRIICRSFELVENLLDLGFGRLHNFKIDLSSVTPYPPL